MWGKNIDYGKIYIDYYKNIDMHSKNFVINIINRFLKVHRSSKILSPSNFTQDLFYFLSLMKEKWWIEKKFLYFLEYF